jgi:hypothetical protein
MRVTVLLIVTMLLSSQAAAQSRTKVGDKYLGQTFEQAFPPASQAKFLEYLAPSNRASLVPLRSQDAFRKLQNGAPDGEIQYQDDPDDNTTLNKVLTFKDHRLVKVLYMFDEGTTFEKQLSYLAAKYGKPFALKTETLQNGYGATWHCRQAFWHLENGDSVIELENKDKHDSPMTVSVSFDLKGSVTVAPSNNPY